MNLAEDLGYQAFDEMKVKFESEALDHEKTLPAKEMSERNIET